MAIDLVTRNEWGARAPKGTITTIRSTLGVKIHYTGGKVKPELKTDHSLCDDAVRGIQVGHMAGNGWLDIGYSLIVCPHGKVFVGRGKNKLPSANGAGLNSSHYAILGLVGNSGLITPTDEMLHGICDGIEYLRGEGGAGNQVKGHKDGYATDCPGKPLYAWVQAGAKRPEGSGSTPKPPVVTAPKWPGRYFEFEPGTEMVHGTDVEKWQKQMETRGWNIVVDGYYGPNSAAFCQSMQGNLDLWEDGIVGPVTWRATWVAPVA